MKFSISILLLILLSIFTGNAQEILTPLSTNSVLTKYYQEHGNASARFLALDDTLNLPFEDDFSRQGVYPYGDHWLDSNVYINTNFANDAYTIGVATFDGLNKAGLPYNQYTNVDTVADFLTSRMLDLTTFQGDTSIWFSFYYQPQGLGDVPESGDSLVLEYKDSLGTWNEIWSMAGRSDTAFQWVHLQIANPIFLFRGFQFRFYNYATVNGNRDHWNLDYVQLLKNSSSVSVVNDNAKINPQQSLLNEFIAMPYPHYKSLASPVSAMKTTLSDSLLNINYSQSGSGASYTPALSIENNGAILFSTTSNPAIPFVNTQNVFAPYTFNLNNYAFPSIASDSTDFLVKSYFAQLGVTNTFNDTSYCTQRFYNYYAYDDGSAEVSYSLTGNSEVSMALKFDIKMQDTLRGLQIFFNPVGDNVSLKLFQLTLWSNVNVAGNSSTLIYRRFNQKPGTIDGMNAFKIYNFDTTLVVGPGSAIGSTIYVGIVQNDPQALYGIGLDRNTDSRGKMFYRVDGNWYQSSVKGTWMIRPFFGKEVNVISVPELNVLLNPFSVYPNPAENTFRLNFENGINSSVYQLTDLAGHMIREDHAYPNEKIDVTTLSKGVYFIRLINKITGATGVQKLIVH